MAGGHISKPVPLQNSSIALIFGFHNVLTLYFSIQTKYMTYRSDILEKYSII